MRRRMVPRARAAAITAAIALAGAAPAGADPAPIAPVAPVAPIDAAPRFELVDRGDAVEVIAHGIRATRAQIVPVRSRLEIPVAGAPQARRATPSDATVKLIELDGSDQGRVLSVKLGFERNDVRALARFAQVTQVGDDLHLLVPRKLPADGAAPDPTPPVKRVAAAAALPRTPGNVAPPPPAPAPPAPAPADAPAQPTPAPAASAHPAPPASHPSAPRSAADALSAHAAPGARSAPAPDARPLGAVLVSERDDVWSRVSMYGALGLAAAGCGLWILRRRQVRPGTAAGIEVIAQRSLGGKARVVWLSAGQREMIVAVTAQQVRMLGQWRKSEAPAALPTAQTLGDPDTRPGAPLPDKPISPAVSGLLKLRGRTGQMAAVSPDDKVQDRLADRLNDRLADRLNDRLGDRLTDRLTDRLNDRLDDSPEDVRADDLWAKEILAATGARR